MIVGHFYIDLITRNSPTVKPLQTQEAVSESSYSQNEHYNSMNVSRCFKKIWLKKKPVCHFLILDTAKNFRVPVNLCHFDSTLVLFFCFLFFLLQPLFLHIKVLPRWKNPLWKEFVKLFLAKYMCLQIFIKIERCFLPFSAACCRK